jgi:hypothetical protein
MYKKTAYGLEIDIRLLAPAQASNMTARVLSEGDYPPEAKLRVRRRKRKRRRRKNHLVTSKTPLERGKKQDDERYYTSKLSIHVKLHKAVALKQL